MSEYSLKALRASLDPEEKQVMKKMYWRASRQGMLFCVSRYMGMAYAYAMFPLINWLYKDKPEEERLAALQRQNSFWNCEAVMHNFSVGILASMEKDHAETGNTTVEAIDSVKASLIGPFAAIGDTIFWITWRVLVTGVALNFSLNGSVFGPLFFILVYNAPKYYLRYYLQLLGYKAGSNFLTNLGKTGLMQQVTKAASVLGTFMIGGMVPMLISVPVTATFSMNGIEQPVIDIFNGVMPGLLELLVMFLMLFLIRKKVNPLLVVLGTFVVCILGAAVGIF
jgi:mannose/fructose/N-acetylgalactosamine-specific phosphotransferase system component IID